MKTFKAFIAEAGGQSGWKVEVSNTSLEDARIIVKKELVKKDRSIEEELPDFDNNYKDLKAAIKKSFGTKRKDMPVISSDQIDEFKAKLNSGELDIFKPFTKGKAIDAEHIKDLSNKNEYLTLGTKDGEKRDDVVKAKFNKVSIGKLKPIQEQIFLDKVSIMLAKFGAVTDGSFLTTLPIIISKEGYIIDGHHRFAYIMLSDPSIKIKVLQVPLGIKDLLKLSLAYGDAVGNQRNV